MVYAYVKSLFKKEKITNICLPSPSYCHFWTFPSLHPLLPRILLGYLSLDPLIAFSKILPALRPGVT